MVVACCSVLHHVAACCSVLQRVTLSCAELQAVACNNNAPEVYVLRYNELMQCVAVRCSVLWIPFLGLFLGYKGLYLVHVGLFWHCFLCSPTRMQLCMIVRTTHS